MFASVESHGFDFVGERAVAEATKTDKDISRRRFRRSIAAALRSTKG